MSDGLFWGSDVPVSMPSAPQDDILVDMGGFGFTQYGLDHNISEAELEGLRPTFSPAEEDF